MPVRFGIHVAGASSAHTHVEAPTYNPSFGCSVTHVGWWRESLIVIYEEKHLALAARMDPPYDGTLDLIRLGEPYALEGDTVYFASLSPVPFRRRESNPQVQGQATVPWGRSSCSQRPPVMMARCSGAALSSCG